MHLVVCFDGVGIVEVQIAFYRILEPVCDRLVVARKRVRLHLGFTGHAIDISSPQASEQPFPTFLQSALKLTLLSSSATRPILHVAIAKKASEIA